MNRLLVKYAKFELRYTNPTFRFTKIITISCDMIIRNLKLSVYPRVA